MHILVFGFSSFWVIVRGLWSHDLVLAVFAVDRFLSCWLIV